MLVTADEWERLKKQQRADATAGYSDLSPSQSDNDFGEFILSPLAEYIEHHGCSSEYIELSLQTLGELTMCFSVEFSIRKFLNEFPIIIICKTFY